MTQNGANTDDDAEEILALGRMISYACQRARSMNLEFSTYCLEMALTSLIQDINKTGATHSAVEMQPARFTPEQIH